MTLRGLSGDGIPAHRWVVEQPNHRAPAFAGGSDLSRLYAELALERNVPAQQRDQRDQSERERWAKRQPQPAPWPKLPRRASWLTRRGDRGSLDRCGRIPDGAEDSCT